MVEECPYCGISLAQYPRYLYCYRCSRQFKKKLIRGGLKEVERSIEKDQRRAYGNR